jgi:glycosyltransferase involved in cell wall biosynthesis
MLTILSVAYPLAPVGSATAGGAEQVLHHLDAALVRAGHCSLVIATEDSDVAGTLLPVPKPPSEIDEAARKTAWARHRAAVAAALARHPVDLVHMHGIDFAAYLPPPGPPVLATLHLPPAWYPPEAIAPERPATWVHCVSQSQHASCPKSPRLLPPIENGVPVDALQARHAKRNFCLFLGRICPEKGVHLAIEAARQAKIPLLIAGHAFGYPEHRRYFDEEVRPHLGQNCRFLGPVEFARKRRLLTAARCLLVPSLAPETSSLVAREALACGTPVVAFPNGALPEVVEHGRTGFLVADAAGMAEAIRDATRLNPETCRAVARNRFSLERMTARYLDLYTRLAAPLRAGAA